MKRRITVTREGGEVVFEATIRWTPEFHEPEIDECWRTIGDGDEVKLRPDFLPDDVADEILLLALDPSDEEEPEPPEYDEDRWKEEYP